MTVNIRDVVQKIIVLLSGAPGAVAIHDQLIDLYEAHGNWGGVAQAVDAYATALARNHAEGEVGVVKFIAQNAFGLRLSDAEASSQLAALNGAGLTTWSARLAHVVTNLTGTPAQTLDNRVAAANQLDSVLRVTSWKNVYGSAQALAAGREWLQGIGPTEDSRELAMDYYVGLLWRLNGNSVARSALEDDLAHATVFIDADADGLRDAGEAATQTTASGRFTFTNAVAPGPIVVTGGTNLATNLPFTAMLSAPAGALYVTPLTTLVQQLLAADAQLTQFAAEARLFASLALTPVDLSNYDATGQLVDTFGPRAEQVEGLQVQATGSQILSLMYVGAALVTSLGGANAAQHTVAALAQAIAAGRVDLSDAATLGAVFEAALRGAGVLTAATPAAEATRLVALAMQAGTALAQLNALSQHAVELFASGANGSHLDAVSDLFKLEALAQAGLAAEIAAASGGSLDTLVADYGGLALLTKLEHVTVGKLSESIALTAGFVTKPPPPPVLALQADTGSSAIDMITSNGQANLSALRSGATWEYSSDGGVTWTAGSGTSVTLGGDGARSLLVRQTDAFGRTSGISAPLNFTLDTAAPAAPSATLHADTGISAGDALTQDGRVDIGGLENAASWQYSVDGGARWVEGSGTSVTFDDLGAKHVLVRQADAAGNLSAPTTLAFTKLPDAVVTLQVDGYNGVQLNGASTGDGVGYRVSTAGDVNGDGYDDMLVSARDFDPAGAAYVVFGSGSFAGTGGNIALAGLDGTNGFRLDGVNAGDDTGFAVTGGGDLNGDGYADVIVSARRAPSMMYSGASYVVFGKADFSASNGSIALAGLDGTTGFTVKGINESGRLGYSLSDAGDVNGDGYDDLLIGAHDTFRPDEYADFTYLIFGKAGGFAANLDLAALDGRDGLRLQGPVGFGQEGHKVGKAGDLNGDGYDDIVIGSPNAGLHLSGAAYVVFGAADFSATAGTLALSALDGANGFRLDGAVVSQTGSAVAGALDVNGDGYADLLVGASGAAGAVYVVYGKADLGGAAVQALDALGSGASRLTAALNSDGTGAALSSAGDFNADGYDDIFVSAVVNRIVYGRAGGLGAEVNLGTLADDAGFGLQLPVYSVSASSSGDFDGDGFADLLLGVPGLSTLSDPFGSGGAVLLRGDDFSQRVTHAGSAAHETLTGTAAAERFVAGNGDDTVNGGGGADVVYGGAGADRIVVTTPDFVRIDGGTGTDTLALGAIANLDLATFGARLEGIERIDLGGGSANTLLLDAAAVLALSNTSNRLVIDGAAGDRVEATDSGWTAAGVANGYASFTNGAAVLLVGIAVATDIT